MVHWMKLSAGRARRLNMCKHLIRVLSVSLVGLMLVVSTHAQEAPSVTALSNADVIKMVEAKLSDDVIVSKIKSSPSHFDTSIDAILKLKAAGVSDALVRAMVESTGTAQPAASATPLNPNDPRSPHDPGIYWLGKDRSNAEVHLIPLETSVYSAGKTGGLFKAGLTYGIAKANWNAVVRGGKANVRIAEASPEFWFYFDEKQNSSFSTGATNPNEFILAKMEAKSNERQLVV